MIYEKSGRGVGTSVNIGFRNDKVGGIAKAFQSALSKPLSKEERHFRHTVQGKQIDSMYVRPARKIIAPFANDDATGRYIIDAMKKRIAAAITKRANRMSRAA
jgi:hypothetical protein